MRVCVTPHYHCIAFSRLPSKTATEPPSSACIAFPQPPSSSSLVRSIVHLGSLSSRFLLLLDFLGNNVSNQWFDAIDLTNQ
ncbi:uncharacterized protein G2W53_005113 [Senna tora]|uniref:Uncharacterized protein n=1 Tax=Senna tora TaxID=362788 RepID=A0A834XCP1_9FABA|nr:uncharacterized protein G2W53_005113 [Senna tora]